MCRKLLTAGLLLALTGCWLPKIHIPNPTPVNPCDLVTCPQGTTCMLGESVPPKAVCVVASPVPEPSGAPSPSPSASPSATPAPTPSPSASPSPAPSPSSPPSSGGIPVRLHECPDAYPRRPDHVKVGGNARRAPANPNAWLINLTPIMDAKGGTCLDENGGSRANAAGQCEQWGGCVLQGLHDDADPLSSWEPAVMAWGPGDFAGGDNVERRSREAEPNEPPCPHDNKACYINYYLANLVLGDGGSPPGDYHVCAAPTLDELLRGVNTSCADFHLTLP